jgi:tight adherence protein C
VSPGLFAALVSTTLIVAAPSIAALVWWTISANRARQMQRRLQPGSTGTGDLDVGDVNPLLQGIASRGQALDKALDKEGVGARLMIQAGWRTTGSRLAFYVFQALLPVVLLAAAFGFWQVAPPKLAAKPFMLPLICLVALMLGLLVPSRVRSGLAEARRARIRTEVSLFIHTLVLLFESGLSTRQAFSSLVREGRGVLTELGVEIEILLRQLEAGAEMTDALNKMAETLEVDDLTTVLALLRQVDRYGGEVKEPLLDTLQVLEDRREMDLREKVNKISGKMTIVMVLFFFPALLIFVAGPSWVSLIKALSGMGK